MLMKFAIKSGIAVGTIYLIKESGIWRGQKETEEIYNEVKEAISSTGVGDSLSGSLPFKVPPLPQSGEMGYLTKHYYNQGIKSSFEFLRDSPALLKELAGKATSLTESLKKQQKD